MKSRKLPLPVLLLSAVLLLSVSASCTPQDGTEKPPEVPPGQLPITGSTPSDISEDDSGMEVIRLTNGEWPPYLSQDLEHYGVVSRIVTEAFALEGVRVEYSFFPWKRAYELAKEGEWDGSVVWLRMPEREKYFYYSEPAVYCNYVFWHLKSCEFDWDNIEELEGVTIGGTWGYFYEEAFSNLEKAGKVRVEWVSLDELNFEKLLKGRIDIYPQDIYVGHSMLQQNFTPQQIQLLTYHPRSIRVDPMCLILSRKVEKNERLLILFNSGLERLRQSGKLDEYLAEALGEGTKE